MYPEKRIYKPSNQPNTMVAIRSTLREDLYVIYAGRDQDTDRPVIKAFVNPLVNWLWIGVFIVIFGTGVALVPNAAQLKSPVPVAVPAPVIQEPHVQPAGVRE
jgi:cytochrome c-type biogenesis protein CcmF